jgi:hypothetical protein
VFSIEIWELLILRAEVTYTMGYFPEIVQLEDQFAPLVDRISLGLSMGIRPKNVP